MNTETATHFRLFGLEFVALMEDNVTVLLQMLVVVVCRWGRFESMFLTMPTHHPGERGGERERGMRGALALYRSPRGKG